jgi:hypothetical protein
MTGLLMVLGVVVGINRLIALSQWEHERRVHGR